MEYTHHYNSPLGGITLASDGNSLTGLWFDGQKYFGSTLSAGYSSGSNGCQASSDILMLTNAVTLREPAYCSKNLPVFEQADLWLNLYFSGKAPDFTPPLSLNAAPFRKAVWDILLTIPFGQTMTYGEIADRINLLPASEDRLASENPGRASKTSARAVGNAVGHNPISLIIPCHRVVGADGSLTGYAGGLERKQALLAMEQTKQPLSSPAPSR